MSDFDGFLAIIVVFGFILTAVLSYTVLQALLDNDAVQTQLAGQTDILEAAQNVILLLDTLSLVVLFGIMLGGLISAFLVRSHPIFFIVSFILQIFLVAVSTMFSTVYDQIASNSLLSASANQFTVGALIISNAPLIILIFTALIAIVTYGKQDSAMGGVPGAI